MKNWYPYLKPQVYIFSWFTKGSLSMWLSLGNVPLVTCHSRNSMNAYSLQCNRQTRIVPQKAQDLTLDPLYRCSHNKTKACTVTFHSQKKKKKNLKRKCSSGFKFFSYNFIPYWKIFSMKSNYLKKQYPYALPKKFNTKKKICIVFQSQHYRNPKYVYKPLLFYDHKKTASLGK